MMLTPGHEVIHILLLDPPRRDSLLHCAVLPTRSLSSLRGTPPHHVFEVSPWESSSCLCLGQRAAEVPFTLDRHQQMHVPNRKSCRSRGPCKNPLGVIHVLTERLPTIVQRAMTPLQASARHDGPEDPAGRHSRYECADRDRLPGLTGHDAQLSPIVQHQKHMMTVRSNTLRELRCG
jgi:hypothetical protein